ncbi:sensor histidine kinase [Neorhizobium galegae]|uniref:sensor histidine kinase n=1 Tax=Neorhizobium galegae TaxID=399 RepID=UPI0006212E0D|nr:PAS domain-containing protein [Neorhizobium galegae]CDZ28111.1 Putative two-component sensor histidine kinase with PAS/PAC domains [Neorhizobium galegae bv. officinalis]KAA9386861.1 PAS domain-containing protein [Neorhizobium galegae]KAB1116004.1 PAS domain-containing protein [Neorhizobium galegae]MCM2499647.1 PAS domain-containing protein [Neorhizobium galegae]MCQ1774041.1 PAS domain-containing protein [Neorhizobium galegae]
MVAIPFSLPSPTSRAPRLLVTVVIGFAVALLALGTLLAQSDEPSRPAVTAGEAAVLLTLATALFAASIWANRKIQRDIDAKFHRLERFMQAFGQTQGMLRSLDGRIVFWGIGAERLYGYSEKEALGKDGVELLYTRCQTSLEDINSALVRDGEWQGELTRRHKDGRDIHIVSKWSLSRGETGEPEVAIEVSHDITSIKLAERQLHQTNALLRAILETAPGLIYAKDIEGRIILANVTMLDLIDRPWSDVDGRTDMEFLNSKSQARTVMANDRRIMDRARTEEFEEVISHEGNHPRIWSSTKAPLRAADGKVIGLVGVSVEITERKRIEERLQLMVNELNHRVKNTLATVQAIASQTLRGGDPIVRQNLERRLMALAAAHDVLTRENWEGAGIDDVVTGALAPFGEGGDYRFAVSGPSLRLLPRAALALAMALHELTTNALKYGALSMPNGQVAINWQVVEGAKPLLRLTWTESGGPPVAAPSRRGFGVRLIERSLAQDFGGEASVIFDQPAGIIATIEAPLADVAASIEVTPFVQAGTQ